MLCLQYQKKFSERLLRDVKVFFLSFNPKILFDFHSCRLTSWTHVYPVYGVNVIISCWCLPQVVLWNVFLTNTEIVTYLRTPGLVRAKHMKLLAAHYCMDRPDQTVLDDDSGFGRTALVSGAKWTQVHWQFFVVDTKDYISGWAPHFFRTVERNWATLE